MYNMKRMPAILLANLLAFSLVGCREASSSAPIESTDANSVVKWFDGYLDENFFEQNEEIKEYHLDAFPSVTFRCRQYGQLEAVTEQGALLLYAGMPIWSVYFYDVTGDGIPDICSTLSVGSGIVDNRILVYDYANHTSYELSERGVYDYILTLKDDSLIVEKRSYAQEELLEEGTLSFADHTISMVTK